MDFARPIRTTRRALGVSQAELALITGVPQSNISRIERGQTETPQATDIMRIVVALDLSIEAFFAPEELAQLQSGEIAARLKDAPAERMIMGPVETLAERIEEAIGRLHERLNSLERDRQPPIAGRRYGRR